MKDIYIWLLFIIGLPVLCYILWVNGYMVLNKKRAVLFSGSILGKSRCKVRFLSCNGFVKKVMKFSDSRSYQFDLNNHIAKGDVSIEILNKNKEIILKLTPSNHTGILDVNKKERYYLVLKFDKADGEYELTWN